MRAFLACKAWLLAGVAILLGGCVATMPTVDPGKVGRPATVAIVDVPDIRPWAVIGVFSVDAPGVNQFHFSERSDRFFAQAGTPMAVTSNYGLVGRVLEQSAADTQARAEGFSEEVLKIQPGLNLRTEFMAALRKALEARGVNVRVVSAGRPRTPRLLWPASDAAGQSYPSLPLAETPPIDADVVLQVSPIAMYNAIGLMHAYNLSVSVGTALYNGRTREFLGRQTLSYKPASARSYGRYDDLLLDLPAAAPPLKDGLVELAGQVAELAAGRR